MAQRKDLTIAFVGIAGIILGAAVQYQFGLLAEESRYERERRTAAYVDYLRGLSERTIAERADDTPEKFKTLDEAYTLLTDARLRIALYGSEEVAKATAAYIRARPSYDAKAEFLALINIMRRDVGHKLNDLSLDTLEGVIYRPKEEKSRTKAIIKQETKVVGDEDEVKVVE